MGATVVNAEEGTRIMASGGASGGVPLVSVIPKRVAPLSCITSDNPEMFTDDSARSAMTISKAGVDGTLKIIPTTRVDGRNRDMDWERKMPPKKRSSKNFD